MNRLPGDSLTECEVVVAHGAIKYREKPGEERWLERSAKHHVAAALRHVERWMKGERADSGTGRHPLAHAATRLLFAVAIELRGDHDQGH